jgi:polyribonucleotide nucleotidyltransferase
MNLKRLLAETGVQVTPESGTEASTTWSLFAPNSEALTEAQEFIEGILAEQKVPELEFGSIYPSIIREIKERGIMVELHPDLPLVFVTNSQLDAKKVCINSS